MYGLTGGKMIPSNFSVGCNSLGAAQASQKKSNYKSRYYTANLCESYKTYKSKDLKLIKAKLEEEPTLYESIKYGNNWVRIGNITFNGISPEEVDSIMLEVIEEQEKRKEEN